jgi:hypothetical protein
MGLKHYPNKSNLGFVKELTKKESYFNSFVFILKLLI